MTIGNGDTIINQYPAAGLTVLGEDIVFLVTDSLEIKMPDLSNWSRKDVITFCNLTNLEYDIEGFGYVIEQNIKANEVIKNNKYLKVKLKDKEI